MAQNRLNGQKVDEGEVSVVKKKFKKTVRVDPFAIKELKGTTTTPATRTSQICIFDNENNSFARFARAFFHFLTFRRRSRSFHDVKRLVLRLCGRREHMMMTNVQFYFLISEVLAPI